MTKIFIITILLFFALALGARNTSAQSTEFTYQGQLQNASAPANGSYDFEFLLFDALTAGTKVGSTITKNGVVVANGTFSVNLDFGSTYPGAGRFLEIHVRQTGGGGFTPLTPRQGISSTPYSIKSITSDTATNATNAVNAATSTNALTANNLSGACVGCVTNSQINSVDGGKVTGTVANAANATNAVSATNVTGNLAGDVLGTQNATVVSNVGGQSAANVANAVQANNAATSNNTPNTLVRRDASGNFNAGTITGNLIGNASTATTAANATNAVNATTANNATNSTNAVNATNATNAVNFTGPMAGDVTGSQSAATVTRLRNVTFPAPVVADNGKVLKYKNNGVDPITYEWATDNTSSGGVTTVTASGPLTSSGGTTPNISLTGTIQTANGGTGVNASGVSGNLLRSNGSVWTSSPLQAADVPAGSANYIQNTTPGAGSNFNISGNGVIGGTLKATGTIESTNGGVKFPDGSTQTAAGLPFSGGTMTGPLNLNLADQQAVTVNSSHTGGTWLNLGNSSTSGKTWNLISSGVNNLPEGAGKLLIRDSTAGVRATFDTSGNFGIGTTAPDAQFQVRTTPFDRGAANFFVNAGAMFKSATNNGGSTPVASESAIVLARDGISGQSFANFARFGLKRYENVGTSSRTQLDISLAHGDLGIEANNTPTIMSLQSGGNVGIGTTTPGQKLSVAGTIESTSGGFKFPDGSTQSTAGLNTTGGTLTGALNLNVTAQQALTVAGSNTGGTWMNLGNTSSGGRNWNLISSGSTNTEGSGKLLIRDGSAVRATFDTNGRFGIGDTSPLFPLTVKGSGAFIPSVVAEFSNGNPDTGVVVANTSAAGHAWGLFAAGTGSLNGAGSFTIGDFNGPGLMTINAAGRVGFGTAAPNSAFHLATSEQQASTTSSSNTGGTWANLSNTSANGRTWNFISSGSANGEGAGKLLIRDNNAGVRATFDTNGNLGIGTTDPTSAKLVVSATDIGVYATSPGTLGIGLFGDVTNGSGPTIGVGGISSSTSGIGVLGQATASTGGTFGGYFDSSSTIGIGAYAHVTGTVGVGVLGQAAAGTGPTIGVYGGSKSTSGSGVVGEAIASSGTTYGVYGSATSASGYGLWAQGRTGASGTKSFRIDHPDDPENKYLQHYSSESPEVINFYRGTVVLDSDGKAVVELPNYFSKINKDPSYTLTAVGAAMPMLHVAKEIDEAAMAAGAKAEPGVAAPLCSFRIAGGAPGAKVSWRIEAVRNDRWVQKNGALVEVEKQGTEKGTYQHPELYGQPKEKGMNYNAERERKELPVPARPDLARRP